MTGGAGSETQGRPAFPCLDVRQTVRLQPELLLLAGYLATVPLYSPNAQTLILLSSNPVAVGSFMRGMALTAIVVALVLAVYCAVESRVRSRAGSLIGSKAGVVCGIGYAVAFVAFTAVLLLVDGDSARGFCEPLGAVAGVCFALVVLAWVRRFPADLANIMLHGGLVCALSTGLNWGLSLLPSVGGLVAAACLAVLGALAPSVIACRRRSDEGSPKDEAHMGSGREGAARSGSGTAGADRSGAAAGASEAASGSASGLGGFRAFAQVLRDFLSIVWLPFTGFLVLTFVVNVTEFEVRAGDVNTIITSSLIASALALAVCLPRFRTPLVLIVNGLVVPGCVAVFILLASFPVDTPLSRVFAAASFAPLMFLSMFAVSLVVAVSKAGEFPVEFVFGVSLFVGLCVALGAAGVSSLNADGLWLRQVTGVVIAVYWAVVVGATAVSFWHKTFAAGDVDEVKAPCGSLSGGSMPRGLGVGGSRVSGAGATGGGANEIGVLVKRRCDAMAQEFGLTERETEILERLAYGQNSTYIANCLFISANTVRVHTYNLYRKLGVSSRGELLDLVHTE